MRSLEAVSMALALLSSATVQADIRAPSIPRSDLYNNWKSLVMEPSPKLGAWADGTGERYGQICDVYRTPDNAKDPAFTNEDAYPGCVAIWLSEAQDNFTVGNLPADQQNNFQNTQHYKFSWNYQGTGLKARTLPRAPQDFDPVCYITTNQDGEMTLGYEEGNGDRLLPCPGAQGGPPISEDQLIAANQTGVEGQKLLEDYCSQCYQSVCTADRADKPRSCGGDNDGGVEVGQGNNDDNVVQMVRQVGPAYHCHMTMADGGACDYVQYDQHEYSREYNMSSAVLCGWERIAELQITHCDCTRVAGTANGCGRAEGLKMALKGVACGNCNNVNQDTAYEQIFGAAGAKGADPYDGTCAAASDETLTDFMRHYNAMKCSQGLFCRNGNLNSDGCRFHCEAFPSDPKCPPREEDQTDAAEWTEAVRLSGNGGDVEKDIGAAAFNAAFRACPVVKYVRNGFVHSIYKRTTAIPEDLDAYRLFTHTWASSPGNSLNEDFEIYSTKESLLASTQRWKFCNYDDDDVGYPRDCGPNGSVGNTWFSMPGGRTNAKGLSSGASFKVYSGPECPSALSGTSVSSIEAFESAASPGKLAQVSMGRKLLA